MVDAQELLKTKKQLFRDTMNPGKKPERLLTFANDSVWKVYDAGEKLSSAIYDYRVMWHVVCRYHQTYGYDVYGNFGNRNPFKFADILGTNFYSIDDETFSFNVRDDYAMTEADYPTLIQKGYVRFLMEDILPRMGGWKSHEEGMDRLKRSIGPYLEHQAYGGDISAHFRDTYGVPKTNKAFFDPAEEYFVWGLRGIKGMSIDLRRRPQEVLDAFAAVDEFYWTRYESAVKDMEGQESDDYLFNVSSCNMGYTILSPKQFEKFYWPMFKKSIDVCIERGETYYMFAEGSFADKMDFFQDFPAGHIGISLESDDPIETKKKLPNVVIIGGFPSHLMGNGTKEECLAYAKNLFEVMAADGNYIYMIDKMISFPHDVTSENLKAVLDYAKAFQLK